MPKDPFEAGLKFQYPRFIYIIKIICIRNDRTNWHKISSELLAKAVQRKWNSRFVSSFFEARAGRNATTDQEQWRQQLRVHISTSDPFLDLIHRWLLSIELQHFFPSPFWHVFWMNHKVRRGAMHNKPQNSRPEYLILYQNISSLPLILFSP